MSANVPRGEQQRPADVAVLDRRRRVDLDDVDRRIIELLASDGRLASRALGRLTGLSEATVASRVRSLSSRRLLGVTTIVDWKAAGYECDVWFEVIAGARSLAAIGSDLAALDAVHSVQTVFGPTDFLVHVILPVRTDAIARVTDAIGAVAGVREVRANVTLDTVKYAVQFARVPVHTHRRQFPAPVIPIDELDEQIISALTTDGRQSNREIARALLISEGTVRTRLGRMESAHLVRIVGQSDPYLTGLINAWAYTMVKVCGDNVRDVADQIAALREATIVALVAGSHEVLVALAAPSRARLIEVVIEGIRGLRDVETTETWEVVNTIMFNYQWARLL